MFTIKKATSTDAQAIVDVRQTAILQGCANHYDNTTLNRWAKVEPSEAFCRDVERIFYLIEVQGKPIATGAVDTQRGTLDAIFVHPEYWGEGHAKRMLNHLESIALQQGCQTLSLDSTLNAAGFYRAHGFEGNEISSYHSPRGLILDCIPMNKNLK